MFRSVLFASLAFALAIPTAAHAEKKYIIGPAPDFRPIEVTGLENAIEQFDQRAAQGDQYMSHGDQCLHQGRFHDAISWYTRAIQHGVSLEPYLRRAAALEAIGNRAAAQRDRRTYEQEAAQSAGIVQGMNASLQNYYANQAATALKQMAKAERDIYLHTFNANFDEARARWENILNQRRNSQR